MSINWSGIDNGTLAGKALRMPLRVLPKRTVMRIRRGPARGLKWITGSSNHGCWLGTYEADKQAALERFVRPGWTIYDIGANAGFYTLFFCSLVGDKGRVFAFEPFAPNVATLCAHLRMNRIRNARAIQAAVSTSNGLVFLRDRPDLASQNTISESQESHLVVPAICLDQAGLPAPDLIKMDVEGAEGAVLEGSLEMLSSHRPIVFVALHGAEQARKCAATLRALNYELHDLEGRPLKDNFATDEIYALPR